MNRDLLTASNLLSITRGLLAIPFVWVMLSGRDDARVWGIVIIAIGILTDRLDGELARRLHQETEWGKILDPLADKVGVAATSLVLLKLGSLPLWFVVSLLLRDLVIFAGGMYLRKSRGMILQSNQAGKWTIGFVAATLILALCDIHGMLWTISLGASTFMLGVSFALYVKRFLQVIQPAR